MSGRIMVETERLWLREHVPEDADAIFEIGRDPLVNRYTGDPCLTSVEEARNMLLERPIADYAVHGFGRWAVILKDSSRLIGMAGLKRLPDSGEVDVGYRILPSFWGQGLATEACRACLRFAFDALGLTRIIGLVNPANSASVRVLEKCGMTFEKLLEIDSQPVACYSIAQVPKGGE
jgi:RimJ/RimL family protein N-acetyltransferase